MMVYLRAIMKTSLIKTSSVVQRKTNCMADIIRNGAPSLDPPTFDKQRISPLNI